jgi:glycosyltransferase involved in cell wall biosynthesis
VNIPADTPRNALCPCGSGKRYKHCHGLGVPGPASAQPPSIDALMRRALEAQQARRLDEAERAYRDALALRPDEPDALHMLGVLCHERGDDDEAIELTLRALDLTDWRVPFMRTNLGIILAERGGDVDEAEVAAMSARHASMLVGRRAAKHAVTPRVTVVVPAYNHARYIERALASVLAQTYRDLELVVIDDGSSDATADLAERVLAGATVPHRVVRRGNRGAANTLNEGASLATGDYVQFLNSDDWLEPRRVERMVDAVAGIGAGWGYSDIALVDADGEPIDVLKHRRAFDLIRATSSVAFRLSVGFSLIPTNTAVSSGNLFVERALFDRVGGFRDFRWNHDWDFALRALWLDEPVFVDERLYAYRLHASNTIEESAARSRDEMGSITGDYLARAMDEGARPSNPFAPAMATWGSAFLNVLLSSGIGGIVDPAVLRRVAMTKLARSGVPAQAATT